MFARLTLLLVAATLFISSLDAQAPKQPRMDALGDPLPDGAIARLGTLRYKHAPSGDPTIDVATFSPDGKRIASLVYGRGSVHICDAATGKEIRGTWNSRYGCTAFAFSPDGSMLAMATNQPQVPPQGANGKGPPGQDVICLFDIAGGKLAKALIGQPESIRAIIFADGGKTLVSAGTGTIRWWEVPTGKELRSWQPLANEKEPAGGETKKTKTFFNCVLAPDGKAIALHAFFFDGKNPRLRPGPRNPVGDQEALGINLETRKIAWRLVRKGNPNDNQNQIQTTQQMRFAFSADGKCVAIAMGTDKVELRDTHNGKLLMNPLVGGAGFPEGLALSADGALVAVANQSSNVTLWQADDTTKPRTYKARKLVARIAQFWGNSTHGLDFSPDGKKLLVGVDADLQVYDVATLQEIHPADGHRGWIDYVAFAADGKRLLTGCADMNLHSQELAAWDTTTWKRLQLTSERTPPWPSFGIASPDQAVYVGNAGADRSGLFDLKTGKLLSRIHVPGNQAGQGRGFFSPGGNFYMLSGQDAKRKAIERLYDVRSGKLRAELPPLIMVQQTMESARPIAFSFDERLVAFFCQQNGAIQVFNTLTGKPLQRLGGGVDLGNGPNGGGFAASLAFTRDAKMLASWNSRDSVIRLWDLATGKELMQVTHTEMGPNNQGGPNQARVHFAWSPDTRLLAVGQNKIQLLELATLGVRREWAGHKDGSVRAVAISPDGHLLASGSSDTTVLIWDMTCADDAAGSKGPLAHDDLAKHWQALALNDAAGAFAAIRALASSPKESVTWIGEQIKPVVPHDVKLVDDLIGRLDDNRYAVRQKASAELLKIGERVVPALDKILVGNPTLEVRLRVQDLRKRMTGLVLNGQRLQAYRAVEVLERIGTPQAREVLQAFAGGAPGAMLTVQARAALERK